MQYLIEYVSRRKDGSMDSERMGEDVEVIELKEGKSAIFSYLLQPERGGFVTSEVEDIAHTNEDGVHRCFVTTKNSVYTLKEIV